MREKIRGREPMMTADQARTQVRSDLVELIGHYTARGFSAGPAQKRVARAIGRSPHWIRRILARDSDATVGLHDGWNIRAAYERLCDRIAAGSAAIEAENDELRRDLDAALSRDRTAPARLARQQGAEAAPARGPGRAPAPALAAPAAPARRLGATARDDLSDLPLWRGITEE